MNLPMRERAKLFLMENKYSIFPTSKTKVPLVAWQEFQHRFPTIDEIDSWWDRFPEAQIGIVCGELSNLTVVDIEYGADASFIKDHTETTMVKTGGNGIHLYYSYCEGIKNATRIKPLVDIRSEGGYVVSPYSVSEKGSYEYIQIKEELLPFPKELFPQKMSYGNSTNTSDSLPKNLTTNEISVGLIDSYPGYGPGQRNDQMARFIGKVLVRINVVHWDTVGWAIVTKANDKNTPPLGPRELQVTWNSIKGCRVRATPISGLELAQTESCLTKNEATEIAKVDDSVKMIAKVAEDQKINTEDVYPFQMPCFDNAIEGGICPGDLIIVSGQTGEGKTSLAQDWTLSWLRGEKRVPVLWFSYEVLYANLWKKFKKMGAKEDELIVVPATNTTGNMEWVETKVKEAKENFGAKIVIIDHLGFLMPRVTNKVLDKVSSNYATYLTQIVKDIKALAIREEIMIVLPVPMKKTDKVDTDAIRDSGGIAAEADLVFLIERERNRDRDAKSYFTDFTRITISKNRKTGTTVKAWFTMINQRFAYDKRNKDEEDNENIWKSFDKKPEGFVGEENKITNPYKENEIDFEEEEN